MRRPLSVFAVAFGLMLIVGIAFAQVGAFAPDESVTDRETADEQAVPVVPDAPDDEPASEPLVATAGEDHDEGAEADAGEGSAEGDEQHAVAPATDETEAGHDADETHGADEPADATPPAFAILHPEDGQHFETESVVFEGEVEPGSRVFAGEFEADVNDEGGWRIVLLLNPGQNVATLRAVDAAGNEAIDTVTVNYDVPEDEPAEEPGGGEEPGHGEEPPEEPGHGEEPPEERAEEPAEEPAAVEFSANQQYGSCDEPVPYDVFYGTATPGTTVHVVSPYGSGSTTANGDGHWELRVDFPNAPFGATFEVVVEGEGGRSVFSFVRTGEEHER